MSFLKRRGKNWYYYWTDSEGKKHGKTLETSDAVVAEVKKGIEDKKRRAGETGEVAKDIPWNVFEKEFLAEYRGKTLEAYTLAMGHFRRIVKPIFVSALTYNDAKKYKTGLREYRHPKTKKALKENSINIYLRPLHTAFVEAVRMGYAAKNIFEDVEQINVTKRVPRYLTIEQVRALKREAKLSPHPDLYLMLLFLLHTGVRRQELLNLKWASLDLNQGVFYLHGSETWEPKDREEHAIGLHKDLVKALRKRPRTSPYVFPGRNGVKDENAVCRLFNRLYARAGIDTKGLHITRHTFATHFPGPEKVLQRVLGHSDPATTQRYRHVMPEELKSVKNLNY